ncbi:MAG: hypothetical protein ACSLFQ_08795 [Thermoanaerobaculia bacterium]
MSLSAKTGPRVAARGWGAFAIRATVSACALLALRWPLPVFWASVRGHGAFDATVGAFLATFALGVAGLPGFLAAVWGRWSGRGVTVGWWIRGGLVATLAASLTTAAWIGVSVHEIGVTLQWGEVVAQSLPIAVAAVSAVVLRIHVARITSR